MRQQGAGTRSEPWTPASEAGTIQLDQTALVLQNVGIVGALSIESGSYQCRDPGSNRGPSDLQSDALPTELSRLIDTVEDTSKSSHTQWNCRISPFYQR